MSNNRVEGSGAKGGGDYDDPGATLVVEDSRFDSNGSVRTIRTGVEDGALYNSGGTVRIADSVFSDNFSDLDGSAIANRNEGSLGVLEITGSRLLDNQAGVSGGAILGFGTLAITDTLFEGNLAGAREGGTDNGGALDLRGTNTAATIDRSVFRGNLSEAGYRWDDPAERRGPHGHAHVVRRQPQRPHRRDRQLLPRPSHGRGEHLHGQRRYGLRGCAAGRWLQRPDPPQHDDQRQPVGVRGWRLRVRERQHLVVDARHGGRQRRLRGVPGGDFDPTVPGLGPVEGSAELALAHSLVADNGGPTPTHLPAVDSPAVDSGSDGPCLLGTDQRGEPRPGSNSVTCDIGAVEVQSTAPAPDDDDTGEDEDPTDTPTDDDDDDDADGTDDDDVLTEAQPATPIVRQPDYTG